MRVGYQGTFLFHEGAPTPIFGDGRCYLRTDGHLWCFGKKE